MNETVKLAYELCRVPSVTGDEKLLLEKLELWLKDHGFLVERIPVCQQRFNIFAYFTPRPKYTLIYCTHIDTVAPFVEPKVDLDHGILWGRGACDAKGILASMIFASLSQKSSGFDDLALLITVGEEESSDGAKVCNNVLRQRARYVVIGEPTELKAAYGQKGSLVFDLHCEGVEAHSALPHLGQSAIHELVKGMAVLLNYTWPRNDDFGDTLINIGHVNGGCMRNVVAKAAFAEAIMRTSQPTDSILEIIKERLTEGVKIDVKSKCEPFFYHVPDGFDSFLAGFGSDAPYLQDVGKLILLGPGSLTVAHTSHESMHIEDLNGGVAAYQNVAQLCRGKTHE